MDLIHKLVEHCKGFILGSSPYLNLFMWILLVYYKLGGIFIFVADILEHSNIAATLSNWGKTHKQSDDHRG